MIDLEFQKFTSVRNPQTNFVLYILWCIEKYIIFNFDTSKVTSCGTSEMYRGGV